MLTVDKMEVGTDVIKEEKYNYPRSIFFIFGNVFCDRISFLGFKTILVLYTTSVLGYSNEVSIEIFHYYVMICYFIPLIGAAIADSYIGKYKMILYASICYTFGNLVLSVASVTILGLPQRSISLLGMFIMAIGSGGIKPCVCPFGGDQFILPQQELQLQRYFSAYYFTVNVGVLIGTIIAPILREDIKCFGENSCFPVAFGVPTLLMITAIIIFIIGTPMYARKKPEGNITLQCGKCILHAIRNKFFGNRKSEKKDHWLQYAADKYSEYEIKNLRQTINLLYMFLPVPLYWTLYDQSGSTWVLQATRMDGRCFGYIIKPDQMGFINPLLIMILIPVFESFIHPKLYKIGIRRPLQKMSIGGFLIAACYAICAIVEFNIEKTDPVLPLKNEGQLRIFNSLGCDIRIRSPSSSINDISIQSLSAEQLLHFHTVGIEELNLHVFVNESCSKLIAWVGDIKLVEGKSISYAVSRNTDNHITLDSAGGYDLLHKDIFALAKIRVFFASPFNESNSVKLLKDGMLVGAVEARSNQFSEFIKIPDGRYNVHIKNSIVIRNWEVGPGVLNTLLLRANMNRSFSGNVIEMAPPNNVHILWQLPQLIVITISELFFAVTGLQFSFTQAPESMKSVILAAWVLTTTIGNLIVVILLEFTFFTSEVYQYLMYAALMFLNMIIFVMMAMNYTYMENQKE